MWIRTIVELIDPSEHMLFNRDDLYVPSETHTHEFVELEYIIAGQGIQVVNGVEYHVKRGDVIILELGSNHSYYSTEDLEVFNCILYPEIYAAERKKILGDNAENTAFLPEFIRLSGKHYMEVEDLLLKIEREFNQKMQGYQLLLDSYVTILLAILYRNTTESEEIHMESDYLKSILDYLDKSYTHVTLKEIADYFNYSPSYFSKYFKKNMGYNLFDYVNKKKMDEAVNLITTTNYSIENICHQLGYNDKKHFYDLFKKRTGTTPNELRKKS